MANKMISNPFVVGKYLSDEYFCDRIEETAFLLKQIVNGRNVALISPRRMGTTDNLALLEPFFRIRHTAPPAHKFL